MDFLNIIIPILPTCGLFILVLAIGIGFSYLWLNLMLRQIRACPECKSKAAAVIIDTQEIVLSNNVDYRRRKPVRIKEIKITDHYQCEVCEHTWTHSFTRKERVLMDDVPQR